MSHSCSVEESVEGHGDDGQPLAAGELPRKPPPLKGSVGQPSETARALLAKLRADMIEERRNKNDTGKNANENRSGDGQENATRQPSRGSDGGTPQHEEHWQEYKTSLRAAAGRRAERAERIGKENAAASFKKRQAMKAILAPARPEPKRAPRLPPSRGRISSASSSAAASSSGPPRRGGQHSAAASPTNRDQSSGPWGPLGRRWGRGCKGSGSSRGKPFLKRARKEKKGKRAGQDIDEWHRDFADCRKVKEEDADIDSNECERELVYQYLYASVEVDDEPVVGIQPALCGK